MTVSSVRRAHHTLGTTILTGPAAVLCSPSAPQFLHTVLRLCAAAFRSAGLSK
ncbi:hypothetical protein BJ165DRAFT_1509249 [Panaeolus papilionaceus]|nr:hypothetical protein BJ165DRAFT_1509249 [Panaeolus papilionaceus]